MIKTKHLNSIVCLIILLVASCKTNNLKTKTQITFTESLPVILKFNSEKKLKLINVPLKADINYSVKDIKGFTAVDYLYNNLKGEWPKVYTYKNNALKRQSRNKLKTENINYIIYSRHLINSSNESIESLILKKININNIVKDSLTIKKIDKKLLRLLLKNDSIKIDFISKTNKRIKKKFPVIQ